MSQKAVDNLKPPPNPDVESKWLPQKAFACLHLTLVLVQELKISEDCANNASELHFSDVSSNACTWSVTEGDESIFLSLCQTIFLPTFRHELISIRTPDLLGMMDCVCRNTQRRAWRKTVAMQFHWLGVGILGVDIRDKAWKPKGGCAVDA